MAFNQENTNSGGESVAPASRLLRSKDGAAGLGSDQEKDWKRRIHEQLMQVIDLTLLSNLDDGDARAQIREISQRLLNDNNVPLNVAARQRVISEIEDEILGLGPLEPLLNDPTVADILVNGPHTVFVERHGKLQRTEVKFRDNAHLMNVIDRVVSSVGRRIDESSPMVDARLKDGSRVNAIVPPLAIDGPSMSIRRFSVDRLGPERLIELGTVTRTLIEILQAIIKVRLNILISGGTGSGKTTMLNVLSGFIPADERILTIEDSAELQLQQPHVVRLETRPPNIENKGEVSQRDLLRNALRMRPDRIIVGEVRAGEALDMLQAMNTGHDGSITTVHANTARDALGRIENMVAMSGVNLPQKALRAQVASAIHIILQVERMQDGKRRLISMQEIQGMEGDMITLSEIFQFKRRGLDEDGNVRGEFSATGIVPKFQERLKQRGIELPLSLYQPT